MIINFIVALVIYGGAFAVYIVVAIYPWLS